MLFTNFSEMHITQHPQLLSHMLFIPSLYSSFLNSNNFSTSIIQAIVMLAYTIIL